MPETLDTIAEKVTALSNSVDTGLTALSNSVDTRLTALSNSVDTRLTALSNSVDTQLTALSNSVDTRLTTLNNSVDKRFDEVSEAFIAQRKYTEFAFERLETEMNGGFNRLDRKLDRVLSALARTPVPRRRRRS